MLIISNKHVWNFVSKDRLILNFNVTFSYTGLALQFHTLRHDILPFTHNPGLSLADRNNFVVLYWLETLVAETRPESCLITGTSSFHTS